MPQLSGKVPYHEFLRSKNIDLLYAGLYEPATKKYFALLIHCKILFIGEGYEKF